MAVPEAEEITSGLIIGRKYRIVRKIATGSFGVVYLAIDIFNGEEVAVKLESIKSTSLQLKFERQLYEILQGGEGIPRFRWYGVEKDYNILVMDLLGPSLEDLFNYCGKRFSLKTVLMLAVQMIGCVEFFHSKHFIHRDIKPDNFLMGTGENWKKVYLIDYGQANRFRDSRTRRHIPYVENKNMTGTPRYSSINGHLGREQSCRDDLESLGYNLIYFLKGSLPWMNIQAQTEKQRKERIAERKMATPVESLCDGLHPQFKKYFNHCRGLDFEQPPDYMFLRELFRNLLRKENLVYDFKFDWIILKERMQLRNVDPLLVEQNGFQPLA